MFQRNRNLYIKAQIKDVRVKRDRFEGGNQRISSKGDGRGWPLTHALCFHSDVILMELIIARPCSLLKQVK
jgi:hypothetical protein